VFTFEVLGFEVWITRTIVNTWIVMAALIALAVMARAVIGKPRAVPTGMQNAVEAAVSAVDKLVGGAAGERLSWLGNWFFAVFAIIGASIVGGIVGIRPPTADWATTFALAFGTFALIQAMGVRHRGMRYLKSFIEPNPVLLPLNLIGELARPVSLSFRLYGNVLSGLIIMTLIYELAPIYARIGVPAVLHVYFDLFTASLHAYIFCILSASFIGVAATEPA